MAATREELFTESKDYDGVVESGVYKESSKKGTPFLEVTFDVMGHKRTVDFYLSEKAEQMSLERLKDLGWNGSVESPAFSHTEPVKLECKHKEHNGKWYENWTYWGKPREPKVYKPDASKARELAAKYKSLPSATPTPPTSKQPPAPSKPGSPSLVRVPVVDGICAVPTKAPPAPPTAKKAPEEPVWRKAPPLNMEKAWEVIMERHGQDEDRAKAEWKDSIEGVTKETKVNSEDFTDQHWGYVAQFAIPF
jgi:hypothetical protein